jgi:hypothetical protein
MTINDFMERLKTADKTEYQKAMNYMLSEFGTSLHCNRFAIGNSHEKLIARVIRSLSMEVDEQENARRIDMTVPAFRPFSIKYSSGPTVTLHNSQGVNRDTKMHDTLMVTPTEWWFLSVAEMEAYGVSISPHLINRTDSLQLKLSALLKALRAAKYPHYFDLNIKFDRKKCKNRSVSDVFLDYVLSEINKT